MAKTPPRLAGNALRAVRRAAELPGTQALLRTLTKRSLGMHLLAALPESARGELPLDARPEQARAAWRPADGAAGLPPLGARSWPHPASAYARAYLDRTTTPEAVAELALRGQAELGGRKPTMNVTSSQDAEATRREAREATARYASGRPIGPLDGVPFLVKDEFDVAGLPTTLGSPCSSTAPAAVDSTLVARLRRAGAVFTGKTVLTEWGMSPLGNNVHATIPHNAHHPDRAPGGSSTGSGVGVALGLAPLAAGGDGGGSIRIPASLNGVFGLKPTFGRVSRAGDGFKGSVAHAGPLACSTADLALFLDAVASERDPADALTDWAPAPPPGGFGGLLGASVRGLRVGVDEAEWRDASGPVATACREALAALERAGARLVPVRVPLASSAPQIGYLVIGPESLAAHRHEWLTQRDRLGEDVRTLFAMLSGYTALEQLDAQRLRSGLRRECAAALREVDVLASPTTATTAPRYTEQDARSSFSDVAALAAMTRFTFLGNLTGLPAGTAPVGADADGLPIGLQIVGDAWDEACVLAVLSQLERAEVARVRRPPGAIDLLPG